MTARKTNEQFLKEVEDIVGLEYTFLESYKGTHSKIRARHNCTACDCHEYEVTPSNFLKGKRCPKCKFIKLSKLYSKTDEQFKSEVFELVGDEYTFLEKYKGINSPIMAKHNSVNCGFTFKSYPSRFLLENVRCPICDGKMLWDNDSFVWFVEKSTNGEYIFLEEYVHSNHKLLVRHNSDKCNGFKYKVSPNKFINAQNRCPKCKSSKGEQLLAKLLDRSGLYYMREYTDRRCVYENLLRFDFAILDNDRHVALLVEYDGEHHYEPNYAWGGEEGFVLQVEKDNVKNEFCKKYDIPLLRIPYWDKHEVQHILFEELVKLGLIEQEGGCFS